MGLCFNFGVWGYLGVIAPLFQLWVCGVVGFGLECLLLGYISVFSIWV